MPEASNSDRPMVQSLVRMTRVLPISCGGVRAVSSAGYSRHAGMVVDVISEQLSGQGGQDARVRGYDCFYRIRY